MSKRLILNTPLFAVVTKEKLLLLQKNRSSTGKVKTNTSPKDPGLRSKSTARHRKEAKGKALLTSESSDCYELFTAATL